MVGDDFVDLIEAAEPFSDGKSAAIDRAKRLSPAILFALQKSVAPVVLNTLAQLLPPRCPTRGLTMWPFLEAEFGHKNGLDQFVILSNFRHQYLQKINVSSLDECKNLITDLKSALGASTLTTAAQWDEWITCLLIYFMAPSPHWLEILRSPGTQLPWGYSELYELANRFQIAEPHSAFVVGVICLQPRLCRLTLPRQFKLNALLH